MMINCQFIRSDPPSENNAGLTFQVSDHPLFNQFYIFFINNDKYIFQQMKLYTVKS